MKIINETTLPYKEIGKIIEIMKYKINRQLDRMKEEK